MVWKRSLKKLDMKRALYWVVLLGLLSMVGISSCRSKEDREKLAQIDGMLAQVDSVWVDYQALDTSHLFRSYTTFMAILDSFNLYFDDNPQDSSFTIVSQFSQLKGPLKTATRLYGKVGYQIEYTGGQLRDLRNDVRHNRWEDEELEGHLKTEADAIKLLESDFSELEKNIEEGVQRLENELPRMRRVIEAMRIKRENA